MRDLLVLTGLLVVAFCLTVVMGAGMNEWQLATHPVDPTADVSSGLFPAGADGPVVRAPGTH